MILISGKFCPYDKVTVLDIAFEDQLSQHVALHTVSENTWENIGMISG